MAELSTSNLSLLFSIASSKLDINPRTMTHLHLHTNYSFMAGTLSVKQCIGKAVELQLPALAITDTNNLTGAIEFYVEAKKAGIAPIIGVELRTEKEQAVVLAKDYAGYVTLCDALGRVVRVLSEATLEAGSYHSLVDLSFIPAGMYFVRLRYKGNLLIQRLTVLK